MFKPSIIAFDVETTGLDYWAPDFRVLSAAFAWFGPDGEVRTRYLEGEDNVREQIHIILQSGIALVAHNWSYELGCLLYRLHCNPDTSHVDTMRLVQCYDNGGREGLKDGPLSLEDEIAMLEGDLRVKTGLGLESAVSRILPKQFHDHKAPYYAWLRENGVKKGQEGANLQRLPPEMLEAYNVADAVVTLMLYKTLTERFAEMGYDWTFDHKLHMSACRRIVDAKARGVKVARGLLEVNKALVDHEAVSIEHAFHKRFADVIGEIDSERYEAWVNEPKTERGKAQRKAKDLPGDMCFNPKSTTQLTELFVNRLGYEPKFFTKESKVSRARRQTNPDLPPFQPKPSMRAAHLPSYGEGGEMLANLKKRLLVGKQMSKLLELSERDGRFHLDLRACGTKTGRYAGGGGLNVQGLARRDPGLMQCLVADEGHTVVSIDLAAGEPTVVAHYSGDKNYRALTFEMTGKKPYWNGDMLLLDDPYLAFASVSPLAKDEIRKAWDQGLFATWTTDSDVVKKKLKATRAIHKTIFLAKMYGQAARGTVNYSADQGFAISYQQSKELDHQFWFTLFPDVRRLGERLQIDFKRRGWMLNEFGYRMKPDRENLCLNYLIQSSVSGVIKVFDEILQAEAPYAQWISVIHDEQLWQVPDDKLEDFRAAAKRATAKLNEYLGWTVNIATGFATGKEWYSAK